jgi:hypothetical protein
MQALGCAGKEWTGLFSVVAHGDHEVEGLPEKLVDAFRTMMGDVDSDLRHGIDRQRIDCTRMRASAVGLVCRTCEVAEQPFCHLAATGISGAKDENCFHPNLLRDCRLDLDVRDFAGKILPLKVQRDVDESDHHRYLDERTDDGSKRRS